ncbi:alpha-L-rhamnosidase [Litchfieldia alkalitelluris]|uniref:alpha-L-rhamnosidase n=1 Tax=Litchfieldia alkalitelluris TaxID=304268 RepID=UPI00195EE141|nr:alpha-L-rhamnosidase [Litchfieldia alkalitelluris]
MESLKNHFIASYNSYKEGAVSVFVQEFNVNSVKKADFYITALGVYEVDLNGYKVGDQMFAPGYTYYPRDLFFQHYDVSEMIMEGQNKFEMFLGQGWYCGRFTHKNITQIYGEEPAISWVLKLEYSDGRVEQITSSENVVEKTSPYSYAGFYDGEIYHADIDNVKTIGVKKFEGEIPENLQQTENYVRIQEELTVKKVTKHGDKTILDFGQNFAGIIEIDPNLLENQTLILRHGEVLNPDGSLYTENLRKAKATTVYHAGREKKKYRPRFTYMGFRYVELSGVEYYDGLLTAYAIYSDMERTGYFKCENELVQKLYDNQVWGQKSNYVEVPTDCPQRDERMGYTGDGQVFARTGSFNFNTEAFWTKFLKDIRYSQMDNSEGYVGPTIPAEGPAGIGFMSMLGWGNAVTIIPEILWWQYGKFDYIVDMYESMKLFVEAEIRKMGEDNLWIGTNLGDWLMPDKDMRWMAMHNDPVSNSFIVNDLKVISEVAEKLDRVDDAKRYKEQYRLTRDAYIKRFVEKNGKISGDYQGAYIMALQYVIPEGELRHKVLGHLVKMVRTQGMKTGFFSTEFILPLLIEAGERKLAFDVLLNEECPGWMYQVKRGATTTWERWDALKEDGTVNDVKVVDDNMVSFNHYAFGSVGEFYYQYILGIKPLLPGYKKIKIQPYTDKRLKMVSGKYLSVEGLIEVKWEYVDEQIEFTISTPSDTIIELPNGNSQEVSSGTYTFTCKS